MGIPTTHLGIVGPTPLLACTADVTAPPPHLAPPFPPTPPFPACAAVRPLAFGFCLPPQDGGHNEPAPRRLSLRRL